MFLAYRQTVDMFPVYSKTVDMFLTPVFAYRHGGYDYLFHFLQPRRDGSFDDKKYITGVKLPGNYYVLTTIRCRNLPHFAPICHFSHFSRQNVTAESALIIAANRGIRRQIGALKRRFSY